MTASSSVIRWPEEGQFWVWKNPLSLICINKIGSDNGAGEPEWMSCVRWTPHAAEEDLCVVKFNTELAEYLWWEQLVPRELCRSTLVPGDILIDDGHLIFIGPQGDKEHVHVLATWEVSYTRLTAPVYQHGPRPKEPVGKTAFAHLLEDHYE